MPATHGRWPRPWPHSSAVRYSSSENVHEQQSSSPGDVRSIHWTFVNPAASQGGNAPYGVHVALATETRVSGGDDTRVRTREVNVGLKFETADPVDGVVVEAPALQEPIERAGIASELEALVALHQKGALTDSEFAAAKAKLLG